MAALPQPILAGFPQDFWDSEAKVNGVLNGLITAAFNGPPQGYQHSLVAPEGQSGTGRSLRADLLVYGYNGGSALAAVLVFEGKKQHGDTIAQINAQLQEWFKNAGSRLASGKTVFALGARGKICVPFWYDTTQVHPVKVTAAAYKKGTDYLEWDITTPNGYAQVLAYLGHVVNTPHPTIVSMT